MDEFKLMYLIIERIIHSLWRLLIGCICPMIHAVIFRNLFEIYNTVTHVIQVAA